MFEFYHPLYEPKVCLHVAIPNAPDTFFGMMANAEGRCRLAAELEAFSRRYDIKIYNSARLIQQAYAYLKGHIPNRFLVNYLIFKDKKEFHSPKLSCSIVQDLNTEFILANVQRAQLSVNDLNMRKVFAQAREHLQRQPSIIIDFAALFLSSSTSCWRD